MKENPGISTPSGRQSGFSLIEVLIAFSILAVGILGVNAMLINASQSERYSAYSRTADRLAMKKLEELRSIGDKQEDVLAFNTHNLAMDSGTGDKDESFGSFMIHYAIANTGQPNALLATVTVGWGGECDSCIPGNFATYISPTACKYRTAMSTIIFTKYTE